MEEGGWRFDETITGCTKDPVYGINYLSELYFKQDPQYSGRFTVPVLFDKKLERIVSNESADIVRMLNSEFNDFADNPSLDLYPEGMAEEIDRLNEWMYERFNNGVYRAGFATAQEKYEEAAVQVRDALYELDEILKTRTFLAGDQLTEADIRAFTTAIRHDPVYFGHFKCNLIAVKDLENVLNWLKRVYKLVKPTVNMDHIKRHYYLSHKQINPTGIVPLGNGPLLE